MFKKNKDVIHSSVYTARLLTPPPNSYLNYILPSHQY